MKRLLLLFCLLFAAQAEAADRYASTSGSGTTCSLAAPCSYNTAVTGAAAGDTIFLRAGTYPALAVHAASGSGSTYTTISNYDGEAVTIQGTLRPFYSSSEHHLKISGTTMTGAPTLILDNNNSSPEGVMIGGDNSGDSSHHIIIEYVQIKNAQRQGVLIASASTGSNEIRGNWIFSNGTDFQLDHGIYVESADNLIERNKVYLNACYGIQVYSGTGGVNNNRVRFNEVYANGQLANTGGTGTCGGVVIGSGTGTKLYGNIVRDNTINADGVSLCCGATNVEVYNNTIYNNSGAVAGLAINGSVSGATVKNNVLASNPTNFDDLGSGTTKSENFCTTSGGATNCDLTGASAGFVNAAGGDFHILTGSVLKDVGADLGAPYNVDIAGVTRPQGPAWEIGAYEFAVVPVPSRRRLTIQY